MAILLVSAGGGVIAGYIELWTGVVIFTIGTAWFIATYAVQFWRGDAQATTAPMGDSASSPEDRGLVRHQSMDHRVTSLVGELSSESVTIDEQLISLAQVLSDLSTICPTWKRLEEIGIALDTKYYQERHPPSPHGWSDVVPLNEILTRLASLGLIDDEHRSHVVQEWRDKFPPTWKHSHTAQPDQVLMTFDRSYEVYRLTALGKSVARAVTVQ